MSEIELGSTTHSGMASTWLSSDVFSTLTEGQKNLILENMENDVRGGFSVRDPRLFTDGRINVYRPDLLDKFKELSSE